MERKAEDQGNQPQRDNRRVPIDEKDRDDNESNGKHDCETEDAFEVEAGNGYSTERLVEKFNRLEGVEPSVEKLELVKARVKRPFIAHNVLLEDFQSAKKYDKHLLLKRHRTYRRLDYVSEKT